MGSAAASAQIDPPKISHSPAVNNRHVGFRQQRRFLFQLSVVLEFLAGGLCFGLALNVRHLLARSTGLSETTIWVCVCMLVVAVVSSAAVRHTAGLIAAPRLAIGSVIVAAFATLTLLFAARGVGNGTSRPLILGTALLAVVVFALLHEFGGRLLARAGLSRPRFIAVVGDQERAARLLSHLPQGGGWSIVANLELGLRSNTGFEAELEQFREVLRTTPVDEVLLIAAFANADSSAGEVYRQVGKICELAGIKLHVVAEWLENYREVHIDFLGGQPLLTFSLAANSPWALLVKRIFDICAALLLLLLTAPVLMLSLMMVYVDSPGQPLFRQVRCGLRGRLFTMYKLRTMVTNAEELKAKLTRHNELQGPVFKIARDPRITRVGRWLRKSSLDELPQLWNVIKGDMSLVGPRPPTPDEVARYHLSSLRRLSMKPGITGLWQVSGRSRLRDFQDWVELDAEYIRNWSLRLDLRILFRTVWTVLSMSGA